MSDIVAVSDSFVRLRVAERYSEKKKKMCPGRFCVLPIEQVVHSPGLWLLVYVALLRPLAPDTAPLFVSLRRDGTPTDRGEGDKAFITGMRAELAQVGMGAAELRRVTNHSFRAGGATDWTAGGMGASFVKDQGGWSSDTYLVYVRESAMHCYNKAAAMVTAMSGLIRSYFSG